MAGQENFLVGRRWGMPIAERLDRMSIPEPMSGCTLWLGSKTRFGYGMLTFGGKARSAHKVAWELEHGPVPKGLELDHLCRNPACINPVHLEPVTHRENVLRGTAVAALAARRTACPAGHPYSGVDSKGRRICRQCAREANVRYEARQRAKAAA